MDKYAVGPRQQSFRMSLHSGFTLIELLVVVLIIGVLSAVGLPQYHKAVMKSRMGADLPVLVSILNAQEVYYMANGKYALRLEELDVQPPCTQITHAPEGDICNLPNGSSLKIFNEIGALAVRVNNYKLEFAFARKQEGVVCWSWAGNKTAEEVCRSYGGPELPGGNLGQTDFGKRFTIWLR